MPISSQTRHKLVAPVALDDLNMSLEADGNGGASARELVLERDLVVRALPPFLLPGTPKIVFGPR